MGVVAVLQPDARLRAQVVEALAPAHGVTSCADWDDVRGAVTRHGVDAVVVDADFPAPATAISELRTLRDARDVAVLVWTESGSAERLFDLGGAGVDGLLTPAARPSEIRSLVSRSIAMAWGRAAADLLTDVWPEAAASALGWAVAHADEEPRVRALADGIGVPPSKLRDTLRDAGLPTPNQLLLWGRLLLAGARFEDPKRTVESVAYSVRYATPGALSRAMRRHTGLRPVQIREGGGMSMVLRALLERQERTRGSVPASGLQLCWTASAALLLFVATGCASVSAVDRSTVDDILDAPPLDQLHAGVLVVDAETGTTLYAHNEQRRFIPASNQKVLVAAAALSLFGPDFRFGTDVFISGPMEDGVVDGDLVIRPSGDPSMSSRYWDSGRAALSALADSVADGGVARVTGRVVIDASVWDSTTIAPTREVADLPHAYGASGSVLAIDEGEVEIVVKAGSRVREPATVSWFPGAEDFVRARVGTVAADSAGELEVTYLPESRRLIVHGSIPLGVADTLRAAQRDPLGVAITEAANAFARAGIQVDDGWAVQWAPMDEGCNQHASCTRPVAILWSPPLVDLIAGALGPSQNWMAEQLIRALGARFGQRGDWAEGVAVMNAHLVDEFGVHPTDISPRDGSGLSAYNLVTPRAIVRVLHEMASGPFADDFRAALAEPSEVGSTLEERLAGLEGRVFAKTGTISNVNSLSGYLVRNNGQEVIFSVLTNGSGLPASRLRPVIDEIIRVLASTPSSP